MKYSTKHWYYFGKKTKGVGHSLLSKESWDIVRADDDGNTPFSIPKDRFIWIDKCLRNLENAKRAKIIVKLIKSMGISKVISVGVGVACLEYNIKKMYPSTHLTCTDFTPNTIKHLKKVFLECDLIEEFDIGGGKWISRKHTLYLLHRVDTEFDDKQWKTIFSNMSCSNVRYILFVPSGFLTWQNWVNENIFFMKHKIRGIKISFAGYLRTRDAFETLWADYYNVKKEIAIGQLSGFLLEKQR